MFFILSKLLLIFILPLTWIIFLFVWALISKNEKRKKKLLIASFTLLIIFSNPYLYGYFAYLWDAKPVELDKTKTYSCVLVLGGFAGEGPNGKGFFNGSADRFIEGLQLLETGKAKHILISGGNASLKPDHFYEGDWAKQQLKLFNVADSSIIVENRSRNTIENAKYSKVLLQKMGLKPPYILVTSAFHMRRALGIFKKAGVEVAHYPCNYFSFKPEFSLGAFIPDADVLAKWNFYIKEMVGMLVNSLSR
jgi:uncharacterized SAM-binding protein YcdF (DUF218 family)